MENSSRMPDHHSLTQEEWLAEFAEAERKLEKISKPDGEAEGQTRLNLNFSSKADVAGIIDHTLLKLDATEAQIDVLCEEAIKYGFKTVCVRLPHVARCAANLNLHPSIGITSVVGFHEGTYPTAEKVAEATSALHAGATELDMVLPHPLLHPPHQSYQAIYTDIRSVRLTTTKSPHPIVLKVILETALLTREEIIAACIIAWKAGADFVKTSTGFVSQGGARVEDVRVMEGVVGGRGVKVKASGGVRTLGGVREMVEAGAGRVGCSASVAIVEEVGARDGGVGGGEGGY